MNRLCCVAAAFSILGACDDTPTATLNVEENMITTETPPSPNYSEREGDVYMYVAAVSDEDQKKGKKAGDVVLFRYLGKKGDVHRLENVDDAGRRLAVSECASECKVIKEVNAYGGVERLGFDSGSIIGAAFEDAIAGRLVVSTKATKEVTRRKN